MHKTATRYAILAAALLLAGGCARRRLLPEESARNEVFAELLRREDTRDIGSDGFFEKTLAEGTEPRVRIWGAIALGRIGDPAGLPLLFAAGASQNADLRAAAAFAIGEIEDRELLRQEGRDPAPGALTALSDLLRDSSVEVRARAIEALGKAGGRAEALRILSEAGPFGSLGNPSRRLLPELAVTALVRLREPEAAVWLARLAADPDPELQWRALNGLIRTRARECCDVSLALLDSPFADVRAYAARGAGLCGDPAVAARLERLIGPSDPQTGRLNEYQVRYCALQSLASLKVPASVAAIARHVEDPPPDAAHPEQANLAIQAAAALAALESPAGIEPLAALLRYRGAVSNAAVMALARLARSDPARFWERADSVDFSDAAGMRAWSQAMGELGGDEAARRLLRMLEEAAAGTRNSAKALAVPSVLGALAKASPSALRLVLPTYLSSHDPVVLRASAAVYEPGASDSRPWAPLVDACRRISGDDDAETKVALLGRLEPWLHEPEVQALMQETLADRTRNARIAAARWLRVAGVSGLPPAAGPEAGRGKVMYSMLASSRQDRTIAVLETTRGAIELQLFREDAPVTVDNFCRLVRRGFYDGLSFMRVVPFFVVQGGDPRNDQEGGPGYSIRCEINMRPFERGSLGMALAGKDTGGSQFFVTLSPQPHLDGGYTNFGRVIAGMAVVDRLVPGDRIVRARIEEESATVGFRRY